MISTVSRRIQHRLLRAILASAATGCAIYLLVLHLALPELQARLTPAQIEWLRQAFLQHPAVVLGTVVAIAALLGLPVLGVFRWVFGPMITLGSRNRGV